MNDGPDIAAVAALMGDPARASMLLALVTGEALTAGELAREAGITAQTGSSHLAKLEGAELVRARRQGRHVYYGLAHPDVGRALECLMGVAGRAGRRRVRTGPRDAALREARICYDHLAGTAGVGLLDGLIRRGWIAEAGEELALTGSGRQGLAALGIEPDTFGGRRPACRRCLDWSMRRSHLAGEAGAALLRRIIALGWAERVAGSRAVAFSPEGHRRFRCELLGEADVAATAG